MNNLIFRLFIFTCFIAALVWVAPASARSDKKELNAIQHKLEQETAQKNEMESQALQREADLKDAKAKLIGVGQSIQSNEKALNDLEARIADLEIKKKTLDETLQKDRLGSARLVLALERLRRTPPEALIARPGAPLQAAQSELLMKQIIPSLYAQAQKLRTSLAQMASLTEDLSAHRRKSLLASESLKSEQAELNSLVDKRQHLYAAANQDLAEQQQNVQRISVEAQNLQELVAKLDQERARQEQERAQSQQASLSAPRMTPPPRAGQPRLPISGAILTRFDQPDAFGAPSKGITIESRPNALVVAPMGGIVRFAGYFRNYGQLIILEHEGGYHSLIAGFEKIDTVVGQSVSVGEPLGSLGSGGKPTLYYELRLRGQPVNPSKKFTDLG